MIRRVFGNGNDHANEQRKKMSHGNIFAAVKFVVRV